MVQGEDLFDFLEGKRSKGKDLANVEEIRLELLGEQGEGGLRVRALERGDEVEKVR